MRAAPPEGTQFAVCRIIERSAQVAQPVCSTCGSNPPAVAWSAESMTARASHLSSRNSCTGATCWMQMYQLDVDVPAACAGSQLRTRLQHAVAALPGWWSREHDAHESVPLVAWKLVQPAQRAGCRRNNWMPYQLTAQWRAGSCAPACSMCGSNAVVAWRACRCVVASAMSAQHADAPSCLE
jgi:hypothetical protein